MFVNSTNGHELQSKMRGFRLDRFRGNPKLAARGPAWSFCRSYWNSLQAHTFRVDPRTTRTLKNHHD